MIEKVVMAEEDTETVINYPKFRPDVWAELYTTDKIIMKRYEKLSHQRPDLCRLVKEDKYSMTFSVHPKAVGIYPRKIKVCTEEERQIRAERLALLRKEAK